MSKPVDQKLRVMLPPITQEIMHFQLRTQIFAYVKTKIASEEARYAEDEIRNMIRRQMEKYARAAVLADRERQIKLSVPCMPLEFRTQKIEIVEGNWHTTLINIDSEPHAVPLHPTLYKGT